MANDEIINPTQGEYFRYECRPAWPFFLSKTSNNRTKATLIIAPNHLCKQCTAVLSLNVDTRCNACHIGITEIQRHISRPLKVHLVTTISAHQKLSYRNVVNADIVVVSVAILQNKNYLSVEPTCLPEYLANVTSDWDPLRFVPPDHKAFN